MKIYIISFICFLSCSGAFAQANVEAARNALRYNDFALAVNLYSGLINASPQHAIFYYSRGMANYYLDNIKEAKSDFTQAIRLDSTYYEAFMGLAFAFVADGENKHSLRALDRAINVNSNSSNAFYSRGLINYVKKNYKNSVSDYDLALELNPANINAIYGRAIAYYQLKDFQKAKNDFAEYLSKPDNNRVLADESRRLLNIINRK